MIGVVSDSGCDLSPETQRQLGLLTVTQRVLLDGELFRDWLDVTPEQLNVRLGSSRRASLEPPSATEFEALYAKMLQVYDLIVSVHSTGALSGVIGRAREAVRAMGVREQVLIVDSGVTSAPLGEMARRAVELADDGAGLDELGGEMARVREALFTRFVVRDLTHFRRSGAVNHGQELMGNLLGTRPILAFQGGQITTIRTTRPDKALEAIVHDVAEKFGRTRVRLALAHVGATRLEIESLRDLVTKSSIKMTQARVYQVGACLGVHLGPGAIGVIAYPLS